jgi:DNA mismatch repair protein MutL
MESIIQLLPDAIANQIAAGEVVQRPASVVKELLENAVDAGATRIDVFIKDAGKTLIQVTDNGCGMSSQDVRMAFERHATSKIREKDDLFNIRTLGFRGEALASIAAVAQVQLRSRLHDAELGTEIAVEGGKVTNKGACTSPAGSTFQVKNLFFNVPARRNFLKSNPVETRHILNEFIRVAIPNPQIHFSFKHNTTLVYDLPVGDLEQRLRSMFGKELKDKLSWIEEASGYVSISGFIGKPELHRKNRKEQFFFVNDRFIKSNYLNHAIQQAYEEVIPKESYPFYCIFLQIDPVHVDINIHPTKTEVKFDDERTIYVLLQSLVKRGLGEVHEAPVFDFTDERLKEAIYKSEPRDADSEVTIGDLRSQKATPSSRTGGFERSFDKPARPRQQDWDTLYKPDEQLSQRVNIPSPDSPTLFEVEGQKAKPRLPEVTVLGQFSSRYIITLRENQLMLVQQHRAHQRVLYERFLQARSGPKISSQQLLFPQTYEYPPMDFASLKEAESILIKLGFEFQELGNNTIIVYGVPAMIANSKTEGILKQVISDMQEVGISRVFEKLFENIARSVARQSAIASSQHMRQAEMETLLQDLFQCEAPAYSPSGKPVYRIISRQELADFFA